VDLTVQIRSGGCSPRVSGEVGDGAGGGAAARCLPAMMFPRPLVMAEVRTVLVSTRGRRGHGRRRLLRPGAMRRRGRRERGVVDLRFALESSIHCKKIQAEGIKGCARAGEEE
jgi:hypothetical protein